MNGNLLMIEGKPIKKLMKYEVVYTKLWGDDVGKDMAGNLGGTFIGISPKLQLELAPCDEQELTPLLKLFNRPYLSVTYYDTEYNDYCTGMYYAEDVTISLKKQNQMKFNSYQVNLTPVSRRM